jgi:hypothetical protein
MKNISYFESSVYSILEGMFNILRRIDAEEVKLQNLVTKACYIALFKQIQHELEKRRDLSDEGKRMHIGFLCGNVITKLMEERIIYDGRPICDETNNLEKGVVLHIYLQKNFSLETIKFSFNMNNPLEIEQMLEFPSCASRLRITQN